MKRDEKARHRRDWRKVSINVLAIIGAVFLVVRLFVFQEWADVELDYGGAGTFRSYSWWGLKCDKYPLRVMKTDYYGETMTSWCIKVDGEWVPVQIEPDPE